MNEEKNEQIKFIVGCDADGILTDLSTHNLREGKKVFKRNPINVDGYSLEEQFDISNISKPILYAKAFKIYATYCQKEPPRENVSETINDLIEEDFEFNSITSRKFATSKGVLGNLARKWFKDWLKKYNINFSSLQFCDEVRSPQDKLLACFKLNVDVMIEDKPDNALFLAQNGIKVIMIDAPYNLKVIHENITHVSNWNQIKEILRNMKNKKNQNFQFIKKEKEEIKELTAEQKEKYFDSYKHYLKNISIDSEMFKKGDRKFKLIYSSLKIPLKLIYKIKIFGKENIPYQNGFIIASNHNDSTDQYRLGLALGNRPFVGYAAQEIENSFRGKLFKSTGLGIFVNRNDKESKRKSSEIMANYVSHDRIALIFPEGTRKNKTEEGRLRFQNRFKIGTVALAQKTGTGILPVAINVFGKDTIVRFGNFMFVKPTDDLEKINNDLELEIANLSWNNTEYYYQKDKEKLCIENEKYLNYVNEIKNNSLTSEDAKSRR